MRSIWLRARLDTAPRFCGLEIGNAVPHRRQRGIPKGGRTPSHTPRRPRPSASRADWRSGSRCKRSRTAFTSRSRCCEYRSVYTLTHRAPGPRRSAGVEITRTSEPNGRNRNGQSARLDTNFRPQNYGAVSKTLLGDHDDGRVFDFSMGSTFRAIGQSPTRNALVSEIRRDCKGLPNILIEKAGAELGRHRQGSGLARPATGRLCQAGLRKE